MKIIRYEESLYFANVENFKYQIFKLSGLDPNKVLEEIKKKDKQEKNVTFLFITENNLLQKKEFILASSNSNLNMRQQDP
jgi:hypothetical protein